MSPRKPAPGPRRTPRVSVLDHAREVLDGLADPVSVQDPEFRVVFQNRVQLERMGPHLGEHCFRAYEGRESVCPGCPLAATFQDGECHREVRAVPVGGRLRSVSLSTSVLRDRQGKVVAGVSVAHDVTEQRDAEARAQHQAARAAVHVDQTPLAHIEFTADLAVTAWNPAAEHIFGYSRAEALGRHAVPLITPPDAQPRVEEALRVLRGGSGNLRTTNTNVTKDGRRIQCEWYISAQRDDVAGTTGYAALVLDVTARWEAEQALRQSEEKFATAFHASPDAIAINRAADGRYLGINQGFTRITGWTADEVVGRLSSEIAIWVDPRDREAVYEAVRQRGVANDMVGRFRAKDGRTIWASLSARPIVVDGEPCLLTVTRDIDDRRRTEQALVESETTLRAIFTNSRDAIGVSVNGIHTFVNPAYLRVFGYARPEELAQRTILDLIAPSCREDILQRVRRRAAGEPTPNSYETRGLRRDGTEFDMEVEVSSYELRGAPQTLVFLRDVTERNRVRRELEASERRFRALIEKSQDVVTALGADGKVRYRSPSFLRVLGRHPEERLEADLLELVHPEDAGRVQAALRGLLQDPATPQHLEARLRHADGSWVWLEVVATNHVQDPAVGCLVVNSKDITERKRAHEERDKLERQMQHVQKLESLGVLAGGIAHDFNNILMAVLGHAGLALSELSPLSPVRDHLTEIEKAARRAADLTKQMLAYSGKGRFLVQPLDVGELVSEMAHLLEVSVSKRAVLRLELPPVLPPVLADATQLRQVMMNLVINASEALGDHHGSITVRAGTMTCDRAFLATTYLDEHLPEGTYVFLEVTDTGCGMDPETQSRIFDPFFSTKFTGRGLGLAAVLGIVRGHKGAVRVHSQLGRGSAFRVVFPAVAAAAEPLPAVPVAPAAWRGQGTVLLVDDEEVVRAVGTRMLQHLGFRVITADHGRDALDKFRRAPDGVTCVILDLTMPHMDGEETFRELRRIRADVRVVLSSGFNEQEVTQRFAGYGLSGFIQKPYNLAELTRHLRRLLDPQSV